MGEATCDAVSPEGLTCDRAMDHLHSHQADDVMWVERDGAGARAALCLAVAPSTDPILPPRCNRSPGHDGDHAAHRNYGPLTTWEQT